MKRTGKAAVGIDVFVRFLKSKQMNEFHSLFLQEVERYIYLIPVSLQYFPVRKFYSFLSCFRHKWQDVANRFFCYCPDNACPRSEWPCREPYSAFLCGPEYTVVRDRFLYWKSLSSPPLWSDEYFLDKEIIAAQVCSPDSFFPGELHRYADVPEKQGGTPESVSLGR